MNPCKGCKYYRKLGNVDAPIKACHYCYDTGIPRGCPPGKCDKKKMRGRGQANRKSIAIAPKKR